MQKLMIFFIVGLNLFALEFIKVTQKQQDDLGIKTQKVVATDSIDFGPFSARVVLDRKDIISLSAKFESNIENIYVRELEHVNRGQKLITITSNELLVLQQDYLEALLENEIARQNYERNTKLKLQGIISNKRLLESKKIKRTTDLQVELTSRHLLINGFSSSMLKKLNTNKKPVYKITKYAPRSGVVRRVNTHIGEHISSEHKMMEIYADGERYLEITVPVKNIHNITHGDTVLFSNLSAKVTTIGNIINTSSQSLLVRARIEKTANPMINRVYEVKIQKKVKGLYKLKKTALVFQDSKPFVFRKTLNGFEILSVEIIKEGSSCYIVKAHLNNSDEVAARSTAALLSAMESEDE